MAPPEIAVVICIDGKSSIQALKRAQGHLKLPNGRALMAVQVSDRSGPKLRKYRPFTR